MSQQRQIIYLAALLHDIGKFYQRADTSGAARSALLSTAVKSLESSISPLNSVTKHYSHKHVLWTAQAFENLQPHFTQYLKLEEGWTYDKLLRLSATHHAPAADNILEQIIQKADHYSSGVDRDKKGGTGWKDAAEEADNNLDAFKRTRMRSVFEGVSLTNIKKQQQDYKKKLPLSPISLGKDFFPIDAGTVEHAADYKKMWDAFETETKFIQNKTLHSFNESLLFLLEKYTSRIPASTQHLPDVSLFDHLKTTAAFALSLYDYVQDNGLSALPSKEEKPFALVGGALSGIQKFIYSIIAKGAAKNLKGRSFYLQLLTDNVVQLLLDELGLQNGNIIYASGGGFYIIAPNTKALGEQLKALEEKIAQKLFSFHGTELSLALDFVPFGEHEIFPDAKGESSIGTVWKTLGEKLSRKKAKRFGSLMKERFEDFFEPQKVSTETKKDAITGEELRTGFRFLDDDKEQPVNAYTWMQIKMGQELKGADFWILSKEKLTYFPNEIFEFEPAGLGLFNYLVSKEVFDKYGNQLRTSADNVRVIHFNRRNFLEPLQKGISNIYGFAWYGGNDYPENKFSEPKTFED